MKNVKMKIFHFQAKFKLFLQIFFFSFCFFVAGFVGDLKVYLSYEFVAGYIKLGNG